jgi:hypothetical protein
MLLTVSVLLTYNSSPDSYVCSYSVQSNIIQYLNVNMFKIKLQKQLSCPLKYWYGETHKMNTRLLITCTEQVYASTQIRFSFQASSWI